MENSKHKDSDGIDLMALIYVLTDARRFILMLTSVFAIGAVIYSLLLTNYYKSESLVMVQGQSNNSSLSRVSGIAAMAGINISGSGKADRSLEALELIQSRWFLKHLLTFRNIKPSIMAAKSYNLESKELLFNPKIYDPDNEKWVRETKNGLNSEPTYLEVYDVYKVQLSISKSRLTQFILITFEHPSPVFAKEFLDLIISETNHIFSQRDIDRSSKALEYLKKELAKTNLASIKLSMNSLIKAQLETQMLAKIHEDYVLSIIEPAFIPIEKSKPSRAQLCIMITIFGFILSIIIIFLRHTFESAEDKE